MTNKQSLPASVLDLISGLCEEDDKELLLPVIESLLGELQAQPSSEEATLRSIIVRLSQELAGGARSDRQRILHWLIKSTEKNHPAATMQSLLLQLDKTAQASAQDDAAQAGPPALAENAPQPADVPLTIPSLQPPLQDNPLLQRLQTTQKQCRNTENLLQLLITDLDNATSNDDPQVMRTVLQRSLNRLLSDHKVIADNLQMAIAGSSPPQQPELATDDSRRELAQQFSSSSELTGLPDRQALQQEFRREAARVERHGYPLSMALIEIDGFDEIEHKQGKQAAEQAILFYANDVLPFTRLYDYVARLSETHYVVLFPHTDIYSAEVTVARLLDKVRHSRKLLKQSGSSFTLPSFSAGLASYAAGDSFESILARSEKALFNARDNDSSRVMLEKNI